MRTEGCVCMYVGVGRMQEEHRGAHVHTQGAHAGVTCTCVQDGACEGVAYALHYGCAHVCTFGTEQQKCSPSLY